MSEGRRLLYEQAIKPENKNGVEWSGVNMCVWKEGTSGSKEEEKEGEKQKATERKGEK